MSAILRHMKSPGMWGEGGGAQNAKYRYQRLCQSREKRVKVEVRVVEGGGREERWMRWYLSGPSIISALLTLTAHSQNCDKEENDASRTDVEILYKKRHHQLL